MAMRVATVTLTLDVDQPCPSCGHDTIQWHCELSPDINFQGADADAMEIARRARHIDERCPQPNCGYHSQRR